MKKHKKNVKKARKIMQSKWERSGRKTSIWGTSVWHNSKKQKALKVKRCQEKV